MGGTQKPREESLKGHSHSKGGRNDEPGVLESLKDRERRFRAIYEQVPLGMALTDVRTGQFIQCNPKFCEIAGRSAEELAKLDFQTLTHPLDLPENLRRISELREGKSRSFTLEKRYLRGDGSFIWVSVTMVPLWLEGNAPDFYMAVVEDISERKRGEEAQERQMEFDILITKILDRFAAFSGGDLREYIQRSLSEMGRFIGAESVFVALISPDMTSWTTDYEVNCTGAASLKDKHQKVLFGRRLWVEQKLLSGETVQINSLDDFPREASMERESCERDGIKSLLLFPLRGRGEQVSGCVGLRMFSSSFVWHEEDIRRLRLFTDAIANVMERRRVENELYESRQMLQQIFDTIPQRVFWKDKDLRFIGCNKPFAEDAGLANASEVVGKTDHDFPWKGELAERYRADDRSILESGVEKIGFEEPQLRNDGKLAWLRTSKMPLRDPQNRIWGVLGTYEDISDLRNALEALSHSKEVAEAANRAKDQFIAVLSHELRTPLTPVLATVSALQETENLPKSIRGDMAVIHRNVDLEARLIDDLLDVTRISQGKIILRQEPVDVHACVHSALEICETDIQAKQLKVSLKLDAARHFVWADAARLRQVFWNLLKNAVKFTPDEGRITVRTLNEGKRVKIEVADTGIGIEPGAMGRIFNAFEQGEQTRSRRFGGLGLGLSIAKALVELHQGKLTAFSEGKDKGATFTVDIETISRSAKVPAPAKAAVPERMEPSRILLVEDHPDTLQILARLLRKWGYGVTTANCIKGALERASEQKFDLVISDLGLPDGSGCDLLKALQKHGEMQGIALSGYGTDEDVRASLEAGFTEHLTKPVSFQALQTTVQKLLNKAKRH